MSAPSRAPPPGSTQIPRGPPPTLAARGPPTVRTGAAAIVRPEAGAQPRREMPTPPARTSATAPAPVPRKIPPTPAAPAASSSSTSTSLAAPASVGPPGWLASVPPVAEGVTLKPSRFIDAAKKGQDDLLEEFWTDPEKSIDVNKVDPIYMTALHWAARGGHLSTGFHVSYRAPNSRVVVKLLLSWGANSNFRDRNGETPLHKAAFGNYDYVCTALLEAGCDRDVKNKDGLIAMDLTEDRDTRFSLAPPQFVDEPDTKFEQEDADSD